MAKDLFEKEVDEELIKLKKDFSSFKKLKRYNISHEDKLIANITALLGLYAIAYDKEIRKLISEMLDFGESKLWAMQGSRYLFNKLNNKHKIIS